jgi:hypothetical protein
MNERYVFWIETRDGQEVRWPHITKHQALCMKKWTDEHQPPNVKSYGWEMMQ